MDRDRMKEKPIYIWKDLVLVNGVVTREVFEIGEDYSTSYWIGDFLKFVANKYGVEPDDVKSYALHTHTFDPRALGIKVPKEGYGLWIEYRWYM